MGLSTEIKEIQDYVLEVLENEPISRDSNDVLYVMVCENYAKDKGISLNKYSFSEVFSNRKVLKLPAYETVSRLRRKMVKTDKTLLPSDEIQAWRELREDGFKKWSSLEQVCP